MRKRYGRFEQQLLRELRLASCPERTVALIPGRSGYEKRRVLRKLAAEVLVRETAGHLGCDPYGTRPRRKHATGTTTTSTSEAEAQAEEHLGRRRLARV